MWRRLRLRPGRRRWGLLVVACLAFSSGFCFLALLLSLSGYSGTLTPSSKALYKNEANLRAGGAQMITQEDFQPPQQEFVALLVAARARHGTESVEELPLFKDLVPSLISNAPCDYERLPWRLYVGYDAGDPFFDDAENLQQIESQFKTLWNIVVGGSQTAPSGPTPPPLILQRFVGMKGAPCWVWNMLSRQAFEDGASYFFQLNDDSRILTRCWATMLAATLATDERQPNFGVVGPRDMNNDKLLTHAMVHRTHMDIFGKLYPDVFRNWYSDDWLTNVYGRAHTRRDERVIVVNAQSQGTRYKINKEAKYYLDNQIEMGRRIALQWLELSHK